MSAPSVYAVAAKAAADVAATVNFAREHNLRLVIKGGGHSFLGTSNAADTLLIWTRAMDDITLHEAFVPQGCNTPPQPGVSVGAGSGSMPMSSGGYAASLSGCATRPKAREIGLTG